METLRGQIAAQAECEPSLQEIALMRESVPDEAATDVSLFGEKAAPNLPGLDTRLALSRLGNNERLYAKLLKQFLAYHTDTENQFHAALDMGDATGARRIAHTLKGLAGSIGASSLANECSYLEASFTSGNPEVIRNLAKVCFTTLAKVRNILQDAFAAENEARQDLPRTPSAALSEEQQAEKARLLGTLEQYLQEYNAEAASFFSSHERELALLIPSEAYTALQSLLSRFEFEEALEVVTAMAQERNIQSL
jgi:HPt (histidine-containing phosphotransfer) domain-containing protein